MTKEIHDKLKNILEEYSIVRSAEVFKAKVAEEKGNEELYNYHQGRADGLALVLVQLVKLNNKQINKYGQRKNNR